MKSTVRLLRRLGAPIFLRLQFAMRWVLGSSVDQRRFMNRSEAYIRSTFTNVDLPHRKWLAESLLNCGGVRNILEVGCGWGANLEVLARRAPDVQLTGIDIAPRSIAEGARRFSSGGLNGIVLLEGYGHDLREFKDGSFDIVFTDAVLLYAGPDIIQQTLLEMQRVTNQWIVMLELHEPRFGTRGRYTSDGWVRDYQSLVRKVLPESIVEVTSMPTDLRPSGRWPLRGALIKVSVAHDCKPRTV